MVAVMTVEPRVEKLAIGIYGGEAAEWLDQSIAVVHGKAATYFERKCTASYVRKQEVVRCMESSGKGMVAILVTNR